MRNMLPDRRVNLALLAGFAVLRRHRGMLRAVAP